MLKLNRIFPFTKSKDARGRASSSGPASSRASRMIVGVVLAVVLVASGGYLTVSAIKLATGITRTVPSPSLFMRLQVVDASGGDRPAFTRIADNLALLSDSILDITVMDRIQFVTRRVERSLVISREADMGPAKMLALKLRLDPDEVEHVPLELNSSQATVTLIIGRDLIDSAELFASKKEKLKQH